MLRQTEKPTPRVTSKPTPKPTAGPPSAGFQRSPDFPVVGQTVTFTSTSTGATTWNWDFGDGASGSGSTATHAYSTAQTYIVRLTVTGPGGSDYLERSVDVAP